MVETGLSGGTGRWEPDCLHFCIMLFLFLEITNFLYSRNGSFIESINYERKLGKIIYISQFMGCLDL